MPEASEVLVVQRNQRWEVSVGGVTRRLIDWLCTKERAIEHALERAHEVQAKRLVIERGDGTIEAIIPLTRSAA
jgi:Uncharacterized protein conserved in bacteria (DUF2188)